MLDIKKIQITSKKLDHIHLLKDLISPGTWYLDLRSMRFTEISEKIFELYGISKGGLNKLRALFVRLRIAERPNMCREAKDGILAKEEASIFCLSLEPSK